MIRSIVCSGFVDWAFYNATNGQYYPSEGNGGIYAQKSNCYVISEADALPGDLVFAADIGHVGIVGGRDDNGNLLMWGTALSSVPSLTANIK